MDFSVLAPGGSETYARGFLDAIARVGSGVNLVVLLPKAPALTEQEGRLREGGITVIRTGEAEAGTWRARARAQVRVPLWTLRLGASVVFVPREVVPILTPAPLILLAHNRIAWEGVGPGESSRERILSSLNRAAASLGVRRAAAVIVTTDVMRASLPPISCRSAFTVHQGCDLVPAVTKTGGRLAGGEALRLIAVGSLSPHKRFDVVVETAAELRRRGLDAHLEIWGPPGSPDRSHELIRLSEALLGVNPLRGGFDPDRRSAIYGGADLLMMGSSFESFGHAMVEAMRSSTVVVAPDSELVRELCGPAAITYREADPQSAADAIEAALPDLALLARRSLDQSMTFTWDECAARTLAILSDRAGSSAGPRRTTGENGGGENWWVRLSRVRRSRGADLQAGREGGRW